MKMVINYYKLQAHLEDAGRFFFIKLIHSTALGLYREEYAGNSSEEQHQLEHQDGCHLMAAPQHADSDERANNPADFAYGGCDSDPRRANRCWVHLHREEQSYLARSTVCRTANACSEILSCAILCC